MASKILNDKTTFPPATAPQSSAILRTSDGGVAGGVVAPLRAFCECFQQSNLQPAGAVLWQHMRDNGFVSQREAFFLRRHIAALACALICMQPLTSSAQGIEQFFTHPKLAEKSGGKIATD